MNKENISKEFNDFLDSASEETIKEFLQIIKKRRELRRNENNNLNTRLN